MVGAFNQHQFLRFGQAGNESFEFGFWPELIAGTADEQLWLRAVCQDVERIYTWLFSSLSDGNDGCSNANGRANTRVRASGAKSHRCAKRESGEKHRQMEFGIEPVQSRADIVHFTIALVMFPLAQSGSAKVEPQHGEAEAVEGLHRVEHDLVVQRSTKQRVRMTNQCGVRCIGRACVKQRFQASSWPVKE